MRKKKFFDRTASEIAVWFYFRVIVGSPGTTANGAHLKWIKNHVYIHSSLAGKTGLHFFQKYSLKKLGQTFESRTKKRMLIIMRPLDNYILLFYDLKPTWKQLSQSQHLVRNALKSLNINLFSSPVSQRRKEKVGFLFKKNLLAMKHLIITEKRLENGHWLEAQVIIKESPNGQFQKQRWEHLIKESNL